MLEFDKNEIVKLVDSREVKILNTPTSFMANGSYEVIQWVGNGLGPIGNKFWVSPDDIMYKVDIEMSDDINKYFEVMWDENGLNLIPKEIESVDIEHGGGDFNKIKLNLNGDRKHNTINIYTGNVVINDKEELTSRPIKDKKSKLQKIIGVIKDEEKNS